MVASSKLAVVVGVAVAVATGADAGAAPIYPRNKDGKYARSTFIPRSVKSTHEKYDEKVINWHDEEKPYHDTIPYHWDKSYGKYRVGSGHKPNVETFSKDYGFWPSWDLTKYGNSAVKYHMEQNKNYSTPDTYKYGQVFPIPKSLYKEYSYTQPFAHPSVYGKGWKEYVTGLYGLRDTSKLSARAYKPYGYYGPAYKPFQAFKVVNQDDYVPAYVHVSKGSPVSPYYGALEPLYKIEFQEYPGSPKYLHDLYQLKREPYSQTSFYEKKNHPYQIVKQARPEFWDYTYKTNFAEVKKEITSWGPGDYYKDEFFVPVTLTIGGEEFICNIGYTDMKNPIAWKRCLTWPFDGQKFTVADYEAALRALESANKTWDEAIIQQLLEEFKRENPDGVESASSFAIPRNNPDKMFRAYLPAYWNPGYYKRPVFAKYPGYYSTYYPKNRFYGKYTGLSPKYGKWIPRHDQDIHLHDKKPLYVPGLYTPSGVHYPVYDTKTGKYSSSQVVGEQMHKYFGGMGVARKLDKRDYYINDKWNMAKFYNHWGGYNISSPLTYKFLPAYYKGTLDSTNPFWMPRAALWTPAYGKAQFYAGYLHYLPDAKPWAAYLLSHPIDLPNPKDIDWKIRAFGPYAYPGYRIVTPGTWRLNIYDQNTPGVYGFKFPFTRYKTRGYWTEEEPAVWGPKYEDVVLKGKKGEGSWYENAMGLFWNQYKHKHDNVTLPPKFGYHAFDQYYPKYEKPVKDGYYVTDDGKKKVKHYTGKVHG